MNLPGNRSGRELVWQKRKIKYRVWGKGRLKEIDEETSAKVKRREVKNEAIDSRWGGIRQRPPSVLFKQNVKNYRKIKEKKEDT